MVDSVIFNSYLLVAGYGVAALICIFEIIRPSSGYILPAVSAVIFVATTIAALLLKADLTEVILFVLVFLALNLTSFGRRGGKK